MKKTVGDSVKSGDVLKKILRILLPVLTVLWMAFIFSMSAADGVRSQRMSNGICYRLCHIFIAGFEEMGSALQRSHVETVSFVVRKAAHLTEYLLLGILLTGDLMLWRKEGEKKLYPVALLIGTLYAASDEFHQLFSEGRSGQLSDVLIDACGVMLGILICRGIFGRKLR